MFKKILIANRGEIAARIIRTAHKLGIKTVGIYSKSDKNSVAMQWANETYALGEDALDATYLNIEKIIQIAAFTGCEAIHPGYGFLSENADFATACEKSGICFIGPSAKVIALMGSKQSARDLLLKTDIPIVPGYQGKKQDPDTLLQAAREIGFPLLIKPSAGGGGKGMHIVSKEAHFATLLAQSQRESQAYFADTTVILEKYIKPTRHIEVQIAADHTGKVLHLFERDCSIQRRHQKIIEEAPCASIDDGLRQKLGDMAIKVAKAVNYTNIGTVEFVVDAAGKPYFIEMNTRLQVEHAVTEQITAIDLVAWQFAIAAKQPIPLSQDDIQRNGHAIEVRVYAEDPENHFLPATGIIEEIVVPEPTDSLRIESSLQVGDVIGIHYDPLLAKLIAWGETRQQAITKLQQSLEHVHIVGIKNNLNFLRKVIYSPMFADGAIDTDFLTRHKAVLEAPLSIPGPFVWSIAAVGALLNSIKHQQNGYYYHPEPGSPWQKTNHWRLNYHATHEIRLKNINNQLNEILYIQRPADDFIVTKEANEREAEYTLSFNAGFVSPNIMQVIKDDRAQFFYCMQHKNSLYLFINHTGYLFEIIDPFTIDKIDENLVKESLESPIPGVIRDIFVKEGDTVSEGMPLLILEAMKMEHTVKAPYDGVVKKIDYKKGDTVEGRVVLLHLTPTRKP
ncbi:MAG: methylcrotonyl-CoA carboxylase [Pseudomonadota bacterium]|jgi:3-methylcrotonyl-CoA carboxylase alpha subunit